MRFRPLESDSANESKNEGNKSSRVNGFNPELSQIGLLTDKFDKKNLQMGLDRKTKTP